MAREPDTYTPGSKDFPLQDPADLKDRMRFDAAKYIQEEGLTLEGVGWMEVAADLASTKDNLALTGEAIKNAVVGK
ncbi:hypothetical protein JCM8097_006452 [Rhodosporidiobolus ruineniae]